MTSYFFCGIGGSGMLPLALILHARGLHIVGSDRGCDQGRTPEKFSYLEEQGIKIVPQDGMGLTPDFDALVISSAVEDTIPEVRRAKELNIPILKRADVLTNVYNQEKARIGVGGTSGKSTTTGMLAWILHCAERRPTVMNGANFLNFSDERRPFASALIGDGDVFVTECDESDGSIVQYQSSIAVLTNIALDHKPVDQLKPIFDIFLKNAEQQVMNITNTAVHEMVAAYPNTALTVGLNCPDAQINAYNISHSPAGISFEIQYVRTGEGAKFELGLIGAHNVENAVCAIGAALLSGVSLMECCAALAKFKGVARRLQTIKTSNNISVIDDFAHNPDKIRASLSALKESKGRLLVMFQMHGYGPFRLMHKELADSFAAHMGSDDKLYMPDVLYMGGSADTSYGAAEFIADCRSKGLDATHIPRRTDIVEVLQREAKSGDRIVVMGARDDTLTAFARTLIS